MRKWILAMYVSVLFVFRFSTPVSAQTTNLITNGSFETGDFSGWTLSGYTDKLAVGPWFVHEGNNGVWIDTQGPEAPYIRFAYLSQILATDPGQAYDLEFWLSGYGEFDDRLQVYWEGSLIWDELFPGSSGGLDYVFHNLYATGTTTEVKLGVVSHYYIMGLDDVRVAAVPEGSSLLMLLVGISIPAFVLLRRRLKPSC